MLHHASRLVHTACVVPTTESFSHSSSLADILQAAAGRAWVRHVSTNNTTGPKGAPYSQRKNVDDPSRVSPTPIEGMIQDRPKELLSIPQQRLSFRSHISDRRTQMQNERDRIMKTVRSGSRFIDKLRPTPYDQKDVHKKHHIDVVPIDPEYLSEADMCSVDPARIPDYELKSDCASDASDISDSTRVNPESIETTAPVPLLSPISCDSLFSNLLTLISLPKSPPHLQYLLSYHSRPPCNAFHSTRSFNLLIAYAIRHASFKTAEDLLSRMTAEGIKGNLETWKLRVRLMVRCGKWDLALRSVIRTLAQEGWQERMGIEDHGDGMPLTIWIELMSTAKRGAFRGSIKHDIQGVDEGHALERNSKEDDQREQLSKQRKLKASQALHSRRLQILMTHLPSLTTTQYTHMPARVVYLTVWMMLRAGDFSDAKTMTRLYLAGLPPSLDRGIIHASRNIIHLHIPWGFSDSNALREHQIIRSTVEEFFALHKDIKPNARTLFLLLRSFRRANLSGTLARQAVNDFRRKWGYHTESPHVRERVAVFAIRERNIALAESELRRMIESRFQSRMYAAQTEVAGRTSRAGHLRLRLQPMSEIYKGPGIYGQRLEYLMRKVQRMRKRLVEKDLARILGPVKTHRLSM